MTCRRAGSATSSDGDHRGRATARRRRLISLAGALALLAFASDAAFAQRSRLFDGVDGATCDYFNYGGRLAWRHRSGDWSDATGLPQGERPFAQTPVHATDGNRVVQWDVTSLARDWLAGRYPNHGIVVSGLRGHGAGTAVFHSRESSDAVHRPRLVLSLADGRKLELAPIADTTLDCSTFTSLGQRPQLSADVERRLLAQFDLGALARVQIAHATLELTLAKPYGDVTLGVFRLVPPLAETDGESKPQPGLAARYRNDRGIASDPAVLMAAGFDSASWRSQWSYVSARSAVERVDKAPSLGFQPLDGYALQVTIPAGQSLGLDMGYRFDARDVETT